MTLEPFGDLPVGADVEGAGRAGGVAVRVVHEQPLRAERAAVGLVGAGHAVGGTGDAQAALRVWQRKKR